MLERGRLAGEEEGGRIAQVRAYSGMQRCSRRLVGAESTPHHVPDRVEHISPGPSLGSEGELLANARWTLGSEEPGAGRGGPRRPRHVHESEESGLRPQRVQPGPRVCGDPYTRASAGLGRPDCKEVLHRYGLAMNPEKLCSRSRGENVDKPCLPSAGGS